MPRTTNALAPWFGSDRMVNHAYADALKGCRTLDIKFGGGMGIIEAVDAKVIHVTEKHPHIVNLAQVAADPKRRKMLLEQLSWTIMSDLVLKDCQLFCRQYEREMVPAERGSVFYVNWAHAYFVCAWMSRNGTAGTKNEFSATLSTRYNANGGDSVVRFRSACRMLVRVRKCYERATFHNADFRETDTKFKDVATHGIYSDSPWDGPGDGYKFPFTEQDHRDLAECHSRYEKAKVVIRINDTPLIRELYPESRWKWTVIGNRDQHNQEKTEVMIQNSTWASTLS